MFKNLCLAIVALGIIAIAVLLFRLDPANPMGSHRPLPPATNPAANQAARFPTPNLFKDAVDDANAAAAPPPADQAWAGDVPADDTTKGAPSRSSPEPEVVIRGISDNGPPPGQPAEYFPMKIGTTWTYNILIGSAEPTRREATVWNHGDGKGVSQVTTSRFRPLVLEKNFAGKNFTLQLKVASRADKQGELHEPRGVKIDIVKDDLQIFGDPAFVKGVFFCGVEGGDYCTHLVIVHAKNSPNAPTIDARAGWGDWGGWTGEDGFSNRTIFFADRPGTQIKYTADLEDKLLFLGVDVVPGTTDKGIHFLRRVDGTAHAQNVLDDGKESKLLDEAFSEDVWYVRGKGLVRLEQKHGDATTMTWTLTTFSP